MSALTLRLPDKLDQQIRDLASVQHMSLSDFARTALEVYVKQTQQELALQEMVAAAQAMQSHPEIAKGVAELNQELSVTDVDLNAHSVQEPETGWWK